MKPPYYQLGRPAQAVDVILSPHCSLTDALNASHHYREQRSLDGVVNVVVGWMDGRARRSFAVSTR